ncbi:hypothetical protein [Brevibacillus parabrevis]|uniref:hypothetical protein n=1 Tax=Brevibacillus parabrevis TaxID=54914 RepID=UPI0012F48DFE|nr:hypothetical protein [Brevibacillus parabrevis]
MVGGNAQASNRLLIRDALQVTARAPGFCFIGSNLFFRLLCPPEVIGYFAQQKAPITYVTAGSVTDCEESTMSFFTS